MLPISTKTVICPTNIEILHLQELYERIPIADIHIPTMLDITQFPHYDSQSRHYKTISRQTILKKKELFDYYVLHHCKANHEIICVEYKKNVRGVRGYKKKKDAFENAVSCLIVLGDKLMNIKIPRKGKLHVTGCKSEEHAYRGIQILLEKLLQVPMLWNLSKNEQVFRTCLFTVMTNISFRLPFQINVNELNKHITFKTVPRTFLEKPFASNATNIKIPYPDNMQIQCSLVEYDLQSKEWLYNKTSFQTYLSMLDVKSQKKEISKQRKITVLIFVSGCVIMSGMTEEFLLPVYQEFMTWIQSVREQVELVFT